MGGWIADSIDGWFMDGCWQMAGCIGEWCKDGCVAGWLTRWVGGVWMGMGGWLTV